MNLLKKEGADEEIHETRTAIIKRYNEILNTLCEEYNCEFIPLQDKFNEAAKKHGAKNYLHDGTHPSIAGSKLMAREWLKAFKKITKKQ